MRTSAVLVGLFIIFFGFLLWSGFGYPIEIFALIGLINIGLGFATPKSPGLTIGSETGSNVELIVDKARSRSGTYALVFSDSKLVMKKLASNTGVMAVAFLFAIIGGLIGGMTGYSLQEYLVERKRRKIQSENSLMTVTQGDMEIPYESLSQVELTGSKLKLSSGFGPSTIVMSKKYPPMIAGKLREIIPGRCWVSPTSMSM